MCVPVGYDEVICGVVRNNVDLVYDINKQVMDGGMVHCAIKKRARAHTRTHTQQLHN